MGLIKCPDCGKMVSDRAAACPSCGCPADAFNESQALSGAESSAASLMSAAMAYPLLHVIDRKDLMTANECLVNDLKDKLSVSRPITFITSENFAGTPKIVNGEFDFPYVFATSNFHYHLDYMKFTVTKPDGRSFGRYFDLNNLPGEYGPKIQAISDDADEVKEIIEQIKKVYNEPKTYSVPFPGGNDEFLPLACEISSVEKTNALTDGPKTLLMHKTVVFKQVPWASCIDEKANPNKNGFMRTFRNAQLAQFCLLRASMKDNCQTELTLYDWLFKSVSKFRGLTGPSCTEEYKTLRAKIQTGYPFDADLVDKAFPLISLIYHQLPNDILQREPVENVRKKVEDILEQFRRKWEKTCVDLNIPGDFVFDGENISLRGSDGLACIINVLDENLSRTMDDVVDEIKARLNAAAQEAQAAQEYQEQYDYDYEPPRRESGGSFIGGIIKTAAGVALANKVTENRKRNYMDSPNCERAKTGRKSSCWGCPLGDHCTMHDRY